MTLDFFGGIEYLTYLRGTRGNPMSDHATTSNPERLQIIREVFSALRDNFIEGGTYRYLIYQRLGLGLDAYGPLYDAGAFWIKEVGALRRQEGDFDNHRRARGLVPWKEWQGALLDSLHKGDSDAQAD